MNLTALRVEGTLREFPEFRPVNLRFDYPIHRLDTGGELMKVKSGKKPKASEPEEDDGDGAMGDTLDMCFDVLSGEAVTVQIAAEYWEVSVKTVRRRFKEANDRYSIENNAI